MSEPEADRLMKSTGKTIAPNGWPQKLGKLPGFEDGDFVVTADEPIKWRIWQRDGHRWIAAAFANLQHGGSLSVPTIVGFKQGSEWPE